VIVNPVFGFRAARFFLIQYTKTGENVPNNHNITKWQSNKPNGIYIYQMAIKFTIPRPYRYIFTQIGIFGTKI
jgi:hypothetical protein